MLKKIISYIVCKSTSLINSWLSKSLKTWLIIIVAVVIVVGNTGIWVMPNINAQFIVSQNLTFNPFPDPGAQYIYTNYLQPLTFGVFGGSSLFSYIIYTLLITILFILIFLLWFIRFHGEKVAIDERKLLLVVLFPVFMVPFYWIGMDGMTLLLMLMVMINFSSKWVIIPAVLLAIQHFEQGFIGFLVLLGTIIASLVFNYDRAKFDSLKKVSYLICGIILGKVILFLAFLSLHINMSGDRITYMKSNMSVFIDQWKVGWPYIIFSLFGVCWILVFMKIKKTWPLIIGVIFTFFLLLIIGDQTRVGTIVLFPAVFYWIFMDKELWIGINKKIVIFFVIAYYILPVVYVWGGFPFKDLWKYDIKVMKETYKSGLNISQIDPIIPFIRD